MNSKILDTLEVSTVCALWLATVVRVPTAIRSSQSFVWWLAILCESLSMTIAQPPLGLGINRISGIPNLETLLKHVLFIGFEALIFQAIAVVIGKGTARNRRLLWCYTGFTATAMTVVFSHEARTAGPSFLPGQPGSLLLLYWLLYLSYAACVSTIAFALFSASEHKAESTAVRISLGFLAGGFAAGIGYSLLRVLLLFVPAGPVVDSMRLVMYLGLWSFVAGSSLSTIPDYSRLAWSYGSHRKLHPLWKNLVDASPRIALTRPRGLLYELSPHTLDLRLYRRVIEIRDGLISLRDYMAEELPSDATRFALQRGTPADALDVTVAACVIEAARRMKMAGKSSIDPAARHSYLTAGLHDSSLFEEVNFLCALAEAHRRAVVGDFADTVYADRAG